MAFALIHAGVAHAGDCALFDVTCPPGDATAAEAACAVAESAIAWTGMLILTVDGLADSIC